MIQISIIHPSRSRPRQAKQTASKWLSSAKDRDRIEYILSVDVDDSHENKIAYHDIKVDTLLCYHNKNAIQAINRGAEVSKGNLLIVVSDDFDCLFHWDEALLNLLEGKEDYCVKTDDGLQPWLITLPIMDRKYYERFGYIYNPVYNHMYCDTEMTCVAWVIGRYIQLPIRFPHNHYSTGKTPKDAINERADQTYETGRKIFETRKEVNFNIPPELLQQPLPQIAGL